MAKDYFELTVKDELHDNEIKQVQIYIGDLALIPYLKILGTGFNDNSGHIGVVVDGGPLKEQNYIKFDPFYLIGLSLSGDSTRLNSRKYTDANSFFEFAIPSIITGTPEQIAKELKLRPFQERFEMLADFVRRIQAPYDSSLETLVEEFARTVGERF